MKFIQRLEPLADVVGLKGGSHSAASGDLFSSNAPSSGRFHQSYRLADATAGPPNVLIPADHDQEDLFAAVATYYPSRSPLTAQTHVLSREVEAAWDRNADPRLSGRCRRPHLACLGAGLGETTLAALAGHEAGSVSAPSYSDSRRSLSYVLARATTLFPGIGPEVTSSRWVDLRTATGLACDDAVVTAVLAVHATAFGVRTEDSANAAIPQPIREALAGHLGEAGARRGLADALVQTYPTIGAHLNDLRGTFDGRMKALLNIISAIQASSRGPQIDSVATAFFCNELLPGSFAHGKVLARLVPFFPTAMIWYGVFAVMSTQFDALDFGFGIISKLIRDVERPFSFAERPQCDLSIEELRVLSRLPLRTEAVKPAQHRIMEVAVLPGVNVAARFAPDAEPQPTFRKTLDKVGPPEDPVVAAVRLVENALALLQGVTTGQRESTTAENTRARPSVSKKAKRSRTS